MELLGKLRDWLDKRIDDAEGVSGVQDEDERIASFATRSLALYIATSYIANAISKCEIKVFEKDKAVKNELYWALNVSPNPNQNASAFWNRAITKCLYEGSSLMVQPRLAKNWFYIADSFSPDHRPMQEDVFTSIAVEGETIGRDLKASDVCHFKLEDRQAILCVRKLYGELAALIQSADDAFKKAHGDRFTWRTSARARGDAQDAKNDATAVADALAPFLKGANGVLPLKEGQELTRVPSDSVDAKEPMDLRRSIFDFTAQALKIPQSMMYGNMTNSTEIVNQFLTFAVEPYAVMLSDEMTRTFFTFEEWDEGRSRVKVDTAHISHVDVFQMADKVDKLFASGLYTMDDIRTAVGDDPLNTDFSKAHWITKNYALIQDVLDQLNSDGIEGGEKNEEELLPA